MEPIFYPRPHPVYEPTALDLGLSSCSEKIKDPNRPGNYVCTRPLGHQGDHVAHVTSFMAAARWANEKVVVTIVGYYPDECQTFLDTFEVKSYQEGDLVPALEAALERMEEGNGVIVAVLKGDAPVLLDYETTADLLQGP